MVTSPDTVHLPLPKHGHTRKQHWQPLPCAVGDGDGTVDVCDARAEEDALSIMLEIAILRRPSCSASSTRASKRNRHQQQAQESQEQAGLPLFPGIARKPAAHAAPHALPTLMVASANREGTCTRSECAL